VRHVQALSEQRGCRLRGLAAVGELVVEDVAAPQVYEPGQVPLRNLVSTICGIDVHIVYDTAVPDDPRPGHPGHESVGVVVERSDPGFAAADLVLAVPNLAFAGGFAELQLLPSSMAIGLPPGTAPEVAVLAQQLGTTIFAMKRFWSGPANGTAVVLEAGAVGLYFTCLCRLAVIDEVVVSNLHERRLAVARQLGATRTVRATGDAVVEIVREVKGDAGATTRRSGRRARSR
jgi:L-iditol 2-dehydrogenase